MAIHSVEPGFRVGQEVLIEGKTPAVVMARQPDGMLLVRTATELVPLPPVLLAPARGARERSEVR